MFWLGSLQARFAPGARLCCYVRVMLDPLLSDRKFWPLFTTQFLGSFNDNLFKNALVVLALFQLSAKAGAVLVAVSGGLFLLPYAVVSATAGQLADAHEKSR